MSTKVNQKLFQTFQLMDIQRFNVYLTARGNTNHYTHIQLCVHERGNKRIFKSINIKVPVREFDAKRQRIKDPILNRIAQANIQKVYTYILELSALKKDFTLNDISDFLKYKSAKMPTITEFIKLYLNERKSTIKYNTNKCFTSVISFLKRLDADRKRLTDFTADLMDRLITKAQSFYKPGTIKLNVRLLRFLLHEAYNRKVIRSNELFYYKPKLPKVETNRTHLPPDEIKKRIIEDTKADAIIKDMAFFQIGTGISLCDLKAVSVTDIKERDHIAFIEKQRQKTGVSFIVPLNGGLVSILQKYNSFAEINQRRYMRFLSRIGVTSHELRRVRAIELLNKGLPLEAIARTLGHTKTTTTLIYSPIHTRQLTAPEIGCLMG